MTNNTKRNYVGIANSFHDPAMAIVNSAGEVVYAEATERYLQNKRAINNPPDQFDWTAKVIERHAEPDAELVLAQSWSEHVHANLRDDERAAKFDQFVSGTGKQALPDMLLDQYNFSRFCRGSAAAYIDLSMTNMAFCLSQTARWRYAPPPSLLKFDHHLTHAATACLTSPFDEAACAVIDGYGEKSSYGSYVYRDGQIQALFVQPHPDSTSLGFFFMTLCKLCGFGLFQGEEWKVMGLAAYGGVDPEIEALLRSLIRVDGLHIIQDSFATSYRAYRELMRYQRRPGDPSIAMANLAHTGQKVFEDVIYSYLRNLQQATGMANVALGGGCLLNSSANGGVTENTGFRQAYVASAPADDGNAIGAALLAYQLDHPGERRQLGFQSPYLGSRVSPATLNHLLEYGGFAASKRYSEGPWDRAAQLLADGKIIGWVQGCAEFGPRALGNRSILADPRSPQVKDRINIGVKRREEFRPFAPSILHEFGDEYFENYQESPYMERTLKLRPEAATRVPGVAHVDRTGRLQTVKKEWNDSYHKLITAFYQRTGVPVLLNTSFNVMGKPIIHSVEDAIAVFCTSGLDALVIEDVIIEKSNH
jgi:carbamoyltransferase